MPYTRSASRSCAVSIIIPVFNEAESLRELLEDIRALEIAQCEILVIDDGSVDGSAEVAFNAGANVVRHPYNIGNGAAVKSGIRAAQGRRLVLMDGDGQHQPADIPKLLAQCEGYHMIVGQRAKGSKLRFHRNAANLFYNLLASYVTRFKVKDLTSGFRVLSRSDALRFIDLLPNTFSYPTTLTLAFLRSGLTIKYVPIQSLYRAGQSKISLAYRWHPVLVDHHQNSHAVFAFSYLPASQYVFFLRGLSQLCPHVFHAAPFHEHVCLPADHRGDHFYAWAGVRADRATKDGAKSVVEV